MRFLQWKICFYIPRRAFTGHTERQGPFPSILLFILIETLAETGEASSSQSSTDYEGTRQLEGGFKLEPSGQRLDPIGDANRGRIKVQRSKPKVMH
jgi:hypothetical protein